jgi:hypothetical protein
MAAREAAAMPLPSDETTPPVMKYESRHARKVQLGKKAKDTRAGG